MLTIIMKIFKALNSEQSPAQLASAISFAAIIGLTPLLSLHNLLILLIVLWFRVNLTLFLIMWPLFSILGLMLEPISESIGLSLLQLPSLIPIWESFYNTLLGRWSNFYYSEVIGGLLVASILAIILYPINKILISQYREKWLDTFEHYKIIKILKASKIWQLYEASSS
ncbi:MAG: TIGR03546 family protein [Gammaproteobacteria bacterium]|nr:TIGR03546 family protein [Gammaproteobacteria bacterium]